MKAKGLKVQAIPPAAARTIRSFRDIGYDLPRAVADIVDNSIAANATRVDVTLQFKGPETWIRIADDGDGMDADTLLEGMRYGSERDYGDDDLGRFGFGLKTASTSQCQRLTVASRSADEDRVGSTKVEIRCLDLAHIEETNRWEVLVPDAQDAPDHLLDPIRSGPGTVVLWENLDRVLGYRDPFGVWARRRMLELAEEVDEHLAMVFHRFLAGEVEGRNLTIRVNGSEVQAWDPFCRHEAGTTELSTSDLRITSTDGLGVVSVRSFVLPHQNQFSDQTAWRRASGPAKWNRQQGLYIFRANRLIQPGGWNRMRTIEEHNKLARIALHFFPDLDAAFNLNIMKASVRLPDDLRTHLQPIVATATREANKRYRDRARPSQRPSSPRPSPSPSAPLPSSPPDEVSWLPESARPSGPTPPTPPPVEFAPQQPVVVSTMPRRARRAIEEAADSAGELDALGRIVAALVDRHPEVANELGW